LTHGPGHFFGFFVFFEEVTGDFEPFDQVSSLGQFIEGVALKGCSQRVRNGLYSEVDPSQVGSSVSPLAEGEMGFLSLDCGCSLADNFGSFIQVKQV
jgi:hypothetical protein